MLFASWQAPIELYEMADDPGQKINVAADHPDVVATLHEAMIQVLTHGGANPLEIQARNDR